MDTNTAATWPQCCDNVNDQRSSQSASCIRPSRCPRNGLELALQFASRLTPARTNRKPMGAAERPHTKGRATRHDTTPRRTELRGISAIALGRLGTANRMHRAAPEHRNRPTLNRRPAAPMQTSASIPSRSQARHSKLDRQTVRRSRRSMIVQQPIRTSNLDLNKFYPSDGFAALTS